MNLEGSVGLVRRYECSVSILGEVDIAFSLHGHVADLDTGYCGPDGDVGLVVLSRLGILHDLDYSGLFADCSGDRLKAEGRTGVDHEILVLVGGIVLENEHVVEL